MAGIDQKQLNFVPIRADGANPFSADQDLGGFGLTGSRAPVAGTDLTTKDYVDNLVDGLSWKAAVRAATTVNITLSGPQTIDGVSVIAGDRVLVKNQSTPAQNGIYVAAAGAWVRSLDANTGAELLGAAVYVGEGTTNVSTRWTQVNVITIIGTDPVSWVLFGQGGDNGQTLTHAAVSYTGGIEGFGAIADVTGVQVSFTLTVAGLVQFFGSGAALANPFTQGNYLGLAVNINGVDYYLNGTGEQGFNAAGGGNLVTGGFTGGNAISGMLPLALPVGSYTVKLRAFGSGYLESSAQFPTKLTVVYPVITGAMAVASPLTSQGSGPFGPAVINPVSTEWHVVAGAQKTIILTAPMTVVLSAFATFRDPGTNSCPGQVGIEVTSPGPVTTDYEGTESAGGNDLNANGSVVYRAVLLPAGTHTFDLIVRNPQSGAQFQYDKAYMTLVYTVPQAVSPVPFSKFQTAAKTDGDVTGISSTSLIDVPGPVEVTINDYTGGDVLIEVSGYANGGASNRIVGLGLKIDGVEQSDTPTATEIGISPMGSAGGTINGSVGFKWIASGLAPGSHTFRLTHAVSGGSDAILRAKAQRPLRIMVWYN